MCVCGEQNNKYISVNSMSKCGVNFEDVARAIISRKLSNPLTSSLPLRPEFQWLKNYLRPKAETENVETLKPNMSKKQTTRKLMKMRQRAVYNNQNKNTSNNENRIFIETVKTVPKEQEHEQSLNISRQNNQQERLINVRKKSCEILHRATKGKRTLSRDSFSKAEPNRAGKRTEFNRTLTVQPWHMDELSAEIVEPDIVNYMFSKPI